VLLLTAAIELLAEQHYLTCFQPDSALDPLVRRIARAYWREAAQHARLEYLETLRVFETMATCEKDDTIDDFVELMLELDGLLPIQARLDVDNLQRCLWRRLDAAERREIHDAVLAAKRYTFIECGVTHPNFVELFGLVTTPAQQHRVHEALTTVLAPAA
jgi:hypothetical protein